MVGDLHWLIISPVSIQPCPTEMFCFLFSIYCLCLKPWQQEEGKHDCVTFTLCLVRSWPRFGGWRCSQAPPDLLLIPPNEIKRCGIPKYRPHLWGGRGGGDGRSSFLQSSWVVWTLPFDKLSWGALPQWCEAASILFPSHTGGVEEGREVGGGIEIDCRLLPKLKLL